MSVINIGKLNKAEVLTALYHSAQYKTFGAVVILMSVEQAQNLLTRKTSFDYLNNCPLKVDLSSDTVDTWLYDRDNGPGAFEAAISQLVAAAA